MILVHTVSAVRVHPTDPDTVYVAAQRELWAPSVTRGAYRSTDGGDSWQRALFVDEDSACSSLVIDPNNTRVPYAAT